MQIQIVAKKQHETAYEAALFVDTRFKGVDADEHLMNIVNTMFTTALEGRDVDPVGTEIVFNIAIATPAELRQMEAAAAAPKQKVAPR